MSFPIVGLGASAGGLEALEAFFEHVPEDCGQSFVVVQHLSPDFKSVMDQLLSRRTTLRVERVEDGMEVKPGSIYLIPPKKEMIISGGRLLLSDKDPQQPLSLPIDTFFRSLAQDVRTRAVAVVLSGTGSDGSRGIRDIHEAGGLVIVQRLDSCKFDGMPRSALDTGIVDLQLAPEEIPAAIERYAARGIAPEAPADRDSRLCGVEEIVELLHKEYGIDFSQYKSTTLHRRIERRLAISHASSLEAYCHALAGNRAELHLLFKDLLIGVTRFFRDPDAFRALRRHLNTEVLPRLKPREELRVWCAGCATGEEAYSLAILLDEALSAHGRRVDVKIFATDVHAGSLEAASTGCFTPASLEGVDQSYIDRYFVLVDGSYRVSSELRQMIVFAPHNLLKDAPFTKIDLITCRNMLIYLEPAAQKKVLTLFHFALKPRGLLMLGMSESPGDLADEFDTVDLHAKIYRKSRDIRLPHDVRLVGAPVLAPRSNPASERSSEPDRWLTAAREQLLNEFAPPSILVDKEGMLIHTFAGGGRYLTHGDGKSSLCVLDLVPSDLKVVLNGALQRAAKEGKRVDYMGVPYKAADETVELRVTVTPLELEKRQAARFLIGLESRTPTRAPRDCEPVDMGDESRERIVRLEEELQFTRENLQATLEEMETSNEELQAANEELVASNEELQSTNEELQSVNEELYTVNSEYQRKIAELTELNADVDNLLVHTDVGVIFLDRELRVRKFTPQMERTFHLTPADLGRRLESFAHTLDDSKLLDDVARVRETSHPIQREVSDRRGVRYLLRMVPYRKASGSLEGVVVSLVDVSVIKAAEAELRRMSRVFQDAADAIIIEDMHGVIVDVNEETVRTYGYLREELVGRHASLLMAPELVEEGARIRRRCLEHEVVRNVDTMRRTKDGRQLPVLLTLSLLSDENRRPAGIATIAKDVTTLKAAEAAARDAVRRRDEFLALLSHELRNPLSAVLNASRVIAKSPNDGESLARAAETIDRQGWHMARLLDDLLDVARVTSGRIQLRHEVVDLGALVEDTAQSMRELFDEKQQRLTVSVTERPVYVEGDRSRLYQIVENLLSNASKYTPEGGAVDVSLVQEDARPQVGEGFESDGADVRDGDAVSSRTACLRVADNGDGIEDSLLPFVFDMFTQSERTLARSGGGMGVGLTLVRNLVELHGGEISARSEGPGQGSEFVVRLPLTSKRPPEPQDVRREPKLGSRRILIVEDNEDARHTLAILLKMEGHEVAQAADGEAGLAAIMREPPDVALVDIGLPILDGYEVARRVRANSDFDKVVLVAVTGYGQESDHRAVLAAGFDVHLVKPVDISSLGRVLESEAAERQA